MSDRTPIYATVGIAAAIACFAWILKTPTLVYCAVGVGILALIGGVVAPSENQRQEGALFSIGAAHLNDNDFCRHGIAVGQSGTGKSELAKRMLIDLTRNRPDWGGTITDEKADMHVMTKRVFAALGKSDKLVMLRPRMFGQKAEPPRWRLNLIGDRSISWASHSQLIVDTAVSQGQKTSQSHFKTQAIDRMAEAMESIHLAGLVPTIPGIYEFIKFPNIMDSVLSLLMEREFTDSQDRERANALFDGWKQYLAKAPEELSGIRGTIENYTNPYVAEEIQEVFCSAEPNVDISAMDAGKVLFISIPQQFIRERKHIQAFMKILYYRDSLGRFDRNTTGSLAHLNMHLGLFDEGHNSLLASEEGYSDFNTLDKMRSARCAVWLMMQCYTSALPPLDSKAKLDVLKANLGTHVIFRLASEEGRKLASGLIGEHEIIETSRSITRGVTTITKTPKVKPILGPWEFGRRLRDFHAIIRHPTDSTHDYFRTEIPPLTDDGKKVASWYAWRRLQFW